MRPDIDWDRGKALWALVDMIESLETVDCFLPVFIGDDRPTHATRHLADTDQVREFSKLILRSLDRSS